MGTLLANLRAAANDVNRVRPTVAGTWFAVLVAGVLLGAVNTGNNLVYVVLGGLLALLLVNNVLAEWNLRGVRVERRLPAELHAGAPAAGAYVVRNERRRGAAWRIEVTELGAAAASTLVDVVPAGGEAEGLARWTATERGMARLTRVRVGSRYPFGLLLRYRDVDMPAWVLVYPRVGPASAAWREGGGSTEVEGGPPTRGGTGDLEGLRPWRSGEPLRGLHAASTVRAGVPILATRAGATDGEVILRLRARPDEESIAAACGAIVTASGRDERVGLTVGERTWAPARGDAHRRRLLAALAMLERA